MPYIPTRQDFEELDKTYKPTSQDFEKRGFSDVLRDVLYGGLAEAEKGGEYIASMLPGNVVRHVDPEEALGFIHSQIPSENQKLLQNIGKKGIDITAARALGLPQMIFNVAKNVYGYASSDKPEEMLQQFYQEQGFPQEQQPSDIIPKYERTSEQNINELSNRLKFAKKIREQDSLWHLKSIPEESIIKNGQDYLHEDLNPKEFRGYLKKMHEKFLDNPSFKNAHELRKRLYSELEDMKHARKMGDVKNYSQEDINNFQSSIENLDDVIKNSLPKEHQQNWQQFKEKWKKNVVPYGEVKHLFPKEGGVTPGQVSSSFSFPSESIKKVLEDIGESGKRNIFENELIKAQTPKEFTEQTQELFKRGGYSQTFPREYLDFAKQLEKEIIRHNIKRDVLGGLSGAAVGELFHHPIYGALIGASKRGASNLIGNILKNIKNKNL